MGANFLSYWKLDRYKFSSAELGEIGILSVEVGRRAAFIVPDLTSDSPAFMPVGLEAVMMSASYP
jgi:hypothetical protein